MIAYLLYFLFMTRTTAYRIVSIDISTSLLHQSNFNPSRNLLVTQVFTPRPPCSLRCGPADVYLIVRPILARVSVVCPRLCSVHFHSCSGWREELVLVSCTVAAAAVAWPCRVEQLHRGAARGQGRGELSRE